MYFKRRSWIKSCHLRSTGYRQLVAILGDCVMNNERRLEVEKELEASAEYLIEMKHAKLDSFALV